MRDKVKAALRIKSGAFNDEIEGLISACLAELGLTGIKQDTHDPRRYILVERAVILYAKANFGYLPDAEKYQKAYDSLKCFLCLAGGSHAVE